MIISKVVICLDIQVDLHFKFDKVTSRRLGQTWMEMSVGSWAFKTKKSNEKWQFVWPRNPSDSTLKGARSLRSLCTLVPRPAVFEPFTQRKMNAILQPIKR